MTNNYNGHLPASQIYIEPTDRQRAAHELAAALHAVGHTDWSAVKTRFRRFVESNMLDSTAKDMARAAADRINEALLTGHEPSLSDVEDIRYAIEQAVRTQPLDIEKGVPTHYWQGWLVEKWLPRSCVTMLTGDGGVGKSRLALQLAWALSGDGQWLGEAGQMPMSGSDYGNGFEPVGPSPVLYATWEDSPSQIRGRLYWLTEGGRSGDAQNFNIADMRARGHLWAAPRRNAESGLTPSGELLRAAAEDCDARLLVIDTLGAANGASEIDRAQVGAFFSDWAAWADETDCTVLLIGHPPKSIGVVYSGSTGMLGGVRAMWNIEGVKKQCNSGECGTPKNCDCEPKQAYRLVNTKTNYSRKPAPIWLSNRNGIWIESPGLNADYGDVPSTKDKEEMYE